MKASGLYWKENGVLFLKRTLYKMMAKKVKNSDKHKVLHIVSNDKFTVGYINFMKMKMPVQDHFFIISKVPERSGFADLKNIYFVERSRILQACLKIKKLAREADQIIVSGAFDCWKIGLLFGVKDLNKTFLHFWGGDFYGLGNPPENIWEIIKKSLKYRCYKKCAGLVFLIEGEYDKFFELTHVSQNHYVAPMPEDPKVMIDLTEYRKMENNSGVIRIIIGNSATETNQHKEIIDWMTDYMDRNIEVYVPLSYGNKQYKEQIIEYGYDKLGEKFFPLVDFMDIYSYTKLLSSMDIGIFNNNRQQALGNINVMLAMGKKLYLRKDTSMWESYCKEGYVIFSVSDARFLSFQEFTHFSVKDAEANEKLSDRENKAERAMRQWNVIFKNAG